jgi:ubiquinone/menaquinone biosynthesis C-methylase UbiE
MEPQEYQLMDAVEDDMWWYRALHLRVLEALGQPQGSVLDAGCGTGGFLARLKAAWPEVDATGLEYNAGAAARAQAKSGVLVANGSVLAMPFPDASFQAVTSMDVLCHAAVEPALALAEMRRILIPGGMLVLNLPAFQWLLSAHDHRVHNVRRFTTSAATRMPSEAGLKVTAARYWNGLLLPLMVLQRKVMASAPDNHSDVGAFPPWQDRLLFSITEFERRTARLHINVPAGGSVLAVATRP